MIDYDLTDIQEEALEKANEAYPDGVPVFKHVGEETPGGCVHINTANSLKKKGLVGLVDKSFKRVVGEYELKMKIVPKGVDYLMGQKQQETLYNVSQRVNDLTQIVERLESKIDGLEDKFEKKLEQLSWVMERRSEAMDELRDKFDQRESGVRS